MNSLEFIEKEIKDTKENILRWENHIKSYPENEVFPSGLNYWKKILQTFEQIKTELEAWYVLKPDLKHTENELGEHEIELRVFYTDADVELHSTKEKYYKLKKALEVQDEKSK